MPATPMSSSATATPGIPAFTALSGTAAPEQLRAHAELLGAWRAAVTQALMTHHLVAVASELGRQFGWEAATLEALGVPVDLLACFPEWRRGAREPFVPGTSGLRLAPSGAAVPLGTLRLQMAPTVGTVPYTLLLLRALLLSVDPSVRFVVVVEPGADIAALDRLAARFHSSAPLRVRFVPLHCISVFAQDNARAMQDAHGAPVLFVPRAFRAGGLRAEDELDPAEAQRAFGIPVRRSRLYWEGGNIVHDDSRCFVGVDTVSENAARLGLSHDEVLAILTGEFGVQVSTLGRAATSRFDPADERQCVSGQASFHIDLDVALLGRFGRARRPRALVADAARGLDFADDVLRVRRFTEGHFLPSREIRRHLRAEYDASAETRHPQLLEYAAELAAHGYSVVGVPDLRIDPRMDVFRRVNLDFGFCNVLPGLHRGRPAVYHFVSGVRAMDADAARRMRLAGVRPVPVATAEVASALMQLQGALHCCCGSLSTDG
jgi:hypothetical protein